MAFVSLLRLQGLIICDVFAVPLIRTAAIKALSMTKNISAIELRQLLEVVARRAETITDARRSVHEHLNSLAK